MKTVFLSTLDNSFQAGLLKDLLMNEGIESFFKNENMSTVLGNIPGFNWKYMSLRKITRELRRF